MRLTKVLLATAVAGLFATPVFAQAGPPKAVKLAEVKADKQEAKSEKKDAKKADKAAKSPEHPAHKAFERADGAPKKWLAGVPKMTKAEKTQINTIEKKYTTQIATLRKDHLAAEKAGKEDDSQLEAKVQGISDQEKADLRAALTADQQAKFDANLAAKPKK